MNTVPGVRQCRACRARGSGRRYALAYPTQSSRDRAASRASDAFGDAMHVPGVGGLSPEWFRQHVWAISYLRWHQSLCARASGSLPGPSPELPWASGSYPGASGKLIDHFLFLIGFSIFLIGFSIIVIPDAYDVPHGASASLCHWKRKLHQPKKEAGSAEGGVGAAEAANDSDAS